MGQLHYSLICNEVEWANFDCGNPSINHLITDALFAHLLQQVYVYKISMQNHRVGFYSVSVCYISAENSDAPIGDYYGNSASFGAVKLDYIAVDKKVQGNGIGTAALKYIVQEARTLNRYWPVRVLVLDALRDKIDWYSARGFEILNKMDLVETSATIRMYIDLMPPDKKNRLDTYVESVLP